MAPAALPKPGTKYGPCLNACNHKDCASTRAMAFSACTVCAKPIGYDKLFYMTDAGYAHAPCLEDTP